MAVINEHGFPFVSQDGDRVYSSKEWREYFDGLMIGGVVRGVEDDLLVVPQTITSKEITVRKGAVLVKGAMRILDTEIVLTVDDNTSGSKRWDRVVVRLDISQRRVEIVVKKGGANPPTLQRDENIWELSLARLELVNGYNVIGDAQIHDERIDASVCGYSRYRTNPARTAVISTSWAGATAPYTQFVAVPGLVQDGSFPVIYVDYSSDVVLAIGQQESWNMIDDTIIENNGITFKCFANKPPVAIPIVIKEL